MYAIASQFLWIFLCPNVVEPHQSCHITWYRNQHSCGILLWRASNSDRDPTEKFILAVPLSSKQFLYWTGQERVRYPTTADMSISDYHYCPKVSPKDDGYTDRVLCRFLHSSINTTSAQHLIVSLNQSLSCNCIHASISYYCNQSTSCLGQRSILIFSYHTLAT